MTMYDSQGSTIILSSDDEDVMEEEDGDGDDSSEEVADESNEIFFEEDIDHLEDDDNYFYFDSDILEINFSEEEVNFFFLLNKTLFNFLKSVKNKIFLKRIFFFIDGRFHSANRCR